MKVKYTLLGLVALIGGMVFSRNVSSLSYEDEEDLYFTFRTMLTISLSDTEVAINEVVPGSFGNSFADIHDMATGETIDGGLLQVTVSTNNVFGYSLFAKTGNGTTYTNGNLVNTSANSSFTPLATGDSLASSSFQDNQWGYTTDAMLGRNTRFSGLAYNSDKKINETTDMSGTAASGYHGTMFTPFMLGAKASVSQPAGDYLNVITFTAVAN